jgi:hypothetical protein
MAPLQTEYMCRLKKELIKAEMEKRIQFWGHPLLSMPRSYRLYFFLTKDAAHHEEDAGASFLSLAFSYHKITPYLVSSTNSKYYY